MLRALWFQDKTRFACRRFPGSLYFSQPSGQGNVVIDYYCPCGCGKRGKVSVCFDHWNGSMTDTRLTSPVDLPCSRTATLALGYWEVSS